MPRNTKPRKAYRPRRVDADPFGLAVSRAALLSASQRLQFGEPMAAAIMALKQGRATIQHWADMADALNVAEQLCAMGIANDHLGAMLVDENRQVTNASYLVSRHGRQLSITRREVVETDIIPFD
jgi:hypothetical protein